MDERALTVGVLTPHATPGPEIEIPAMTAGRVETRISRTDLPGANTTHQTTSLEKLRHGAQPAILDAAASAIPIGSIDALAFASTSSGYLIGCDAEARLVQRLGHKWALPATSSCHAAVHALRAFGIRRVSLVHPPWFDAELDDLGMAYFRSQGFDAIASRADTLTNDPAQVRPQAVIDWACRNLSDHTEAVFLAGNGFHVADAVDRIERLTGCLVLTANQVLLWSTLAATECRIDIAGYGMLLRDQRSTNRPT